MDHLIELRNIGKEYRGAAVAGPDPARGTVAGFDQAKWFCRPTTNSSRRSAVIVRDTRYKADVRTFDTAAESSTAPAHSRPLAARKVNAEAID